jgi:hypothetical protein
MAHAHESSVSREGDLTPSQCATVLRTSGAPRSGFRVIDDIVPFDDEDESPFVGLLQVEET